MAIIQSKRPTQSRVRKTKLSRTVSSCVLNMSKDGDYTTSLSGLLQCSTTVKAKKKKHNSYIQIEFSVFQFMPIASSQWA